LIDVGEDSPFYHLHRDDWPLRELHLVVDDGQGVRLAGLANSKRQRLAVLGDLKFRVIHHLALHLVRHLQSMGVRTVAGRRGAGRDVRPLLFVILAVEFHAERVLIGGSIEDFGHREEPRS